ncbi:hypothetical protein SAR116_1858 [Candidatus Puniceispirillum marinum IMCC1322]|uniref:Uncharacterized protein n=1 Tax=Puniceispirillum marinum (strain IMCC1322) TaxID=488538 RepID=D5BMQ8_PUNMI|nr:hypothetical protein SAR116_1858 [Candidatus Puniceispirillum marinum IMCC1322]
MQVSTSSPLELGGVTYAQILLSNIFKACDASYADASMNLGMIEEIAIKEQNHVYDVIEYSTAAYHLVWRF